MKQGLQGGKGVGGVYVAGWSRNYPALICKPCLYQGVLGTSTLSQVHPVQQTAANPPPSCPQGVKCALNPFSTRPITQQTYSRRRTGKGTDKTESRTRGKPFSCSQTASIWPLQMLKNYQLKKYKLQEQSIFSFFLRITWENWYICLLTMKLEPGAD